MDFVMELDNPIDSMGLPPLREGSSTSSSFRPSSSTPTKKFGRLTWSHMTQSKWEGKPLGLPSKETQLEEMRHASPRGFAAFRLGFGLSIRAEGLGLSGSCGDEVWKIKRRVLREPLIPIEETLHSRREMQKSMSAPLLFGETASDSISAKSVRKRTRASPELAQASHSSWTDSDGCSLVESCVKLCAWDDATRSKLDFRNNQTGLTSQSPLGPRQRPLPSEVLTRMKDTGWNMTGPSCTVWVQQARHLASSRSHALAAEGSKAIHERIQLLNLLEQHEVPQSVEALRFALKWRCGSLEQAFLSLDVGCRQGRGGLSMLEFAGGLALLGFDVPALCGVNEAVAFTTLDADGDGRLSLMDLLGASAPPESATAGQDKSIEDEGHKSDGQNTAVEDSIWILIAKFTGLYAWFATPVALRRRWRFSYSSEEALALQVSSPSKTGGGAGGAMTVVTALAEGAIGRSCERVAVAQQQACDPVMRTWAPSEYDLGVLQSKTSAEFKRHCATQQLGENLLNKSDFYRLLGDIPPAAVGDDPAAQKLTRTMLSDLFDEVLRTQADGPHGPLTKGLTFESFSLLLLKMSIAMDLHFRHLVEDAVEALCPGSKPEH